MLALNVQTQIFVAYLIGSRLRIRRDASGGTAQHALDPRQHIADAIGFGYVVVGTDIQPRHHVVLTILGRTKYYGDVGSGRISLEQLRELESTHLSHHHIEKYQRVILQRQLQSLFGTVCHIHIVTLYFKIKPQSLTQSLFVVDYKNTLFVHRYII